MKVSARGDIHALLASFEIVATCDQHSIEPVPHTLPRFFNTRQLKNMGLSILGSNPDIEYMGKMLTILFARIS